jgi:dTDP-4-amino-4,6-dideoxygalactose transaminase
MEAIEQFAKPAGLLVLEDAAHAHGALYRGRKVGSLGAAAAFSFYPTKNLGALGDGGAVCTDDDALAARVRRLRNLGQRAKGEHIELGYNERLDGLQAGLLRVKLACLNDWNRARRAHAAYYSELLPCTVGLLDERSESPCVYHLFPTRFADRDMVAEVLRARGIQTGIHYAPAVHGHPAWSDRPPRHGELPQAEAWAAEELSLPMHPGLLTEEIESVVDAVDYSLLTAKTAA